MTTSQPIPKGQEANYALHYLRQIRQNVLALTEMITEETYDPKELEKLFRRLEDTYNKCEQAAQAMPEKMPMTDALQKLSLEFQGEFLPEDPVKNQQDTEFHGKERLETYLDSVNYMAAFESYAQFAENLIKLGAPSSRKKPMIIDFGPPVFSSHTPTNNPHIAFMASLQGVKQDALHKRFGIWLNILEQSSFGSVTELKVGNVVEKQTIVTQKTLMVENNGMIDMVLFIAPHEDWRYLDQFGEYGGRKLDLMQQSRYLVYQKLTVMANQSLATLLSSSSPNSIMQSVFSFITRYHKIFETKCRICKKVMKDYLPCVMFDPRIPQQSMHESCR